MDQTCNVYRYETKATRPLFRGREFLWNEGHTAHATYEEAETQIRVAIEIYSQVYDNLGLSYIKLKRPEFDKFAGADYTIAFDAWNPDGKSNQIGTAHQLGHNFAKAFEMTYENDAGEQTVCANTCYGMGIARTLAAVISQHGDDHGLVLPPLISPKQVVIIPIPVKGKEMIAKTYANEIAASLSKAEIRVVVDDNDRLRPGEKYYKWEMYGVPLRIDVGPREAESKTATLIRRDTLEKSKADFEYIVESVNNTFNEIQKSITEKSRKVHEHRIATANTIEELKKYMEEKKLVRINWCGDQQCAENLKEQVSGEIRGTRWPEKETPAGPCILCSVKAILVAYVCRTY